jgi:glycosyltransferase involved in cell wall biosynthesis
MPLRYIVITPARNEENNLPLTIRSMLSQRLRPARWIIVNDGSTDRTGSILDAAAREHDWIHSVHRADRGFRKQGGGVIEAFYDGYRLIENEQWDFLVKFDADLSFDSNYFASCLHKFLNDPSLGIGGGLICRKNDGSTTVDSPGDPRFHVRGATKIYRRECWCQISPLVKSPGWDTIDELKANMLGWTTFTFPELKLFQHRATGAADGSWRNWVKNGLANYVTGYHPLFMAAKCVKRLFSRPVGIASLGLAWGFVSGYLQSVPRGTEPGLLRYVQREQMSYLVGKPSLWR